jgi:hypothetical protein
LETREIDCHLLKGYKMPQIKYESDPKTIQDLVNLYAKGHLNLEPGFQRNSVWSKSDRAKLIDSILRNYPLPSIFLYKREQDGYYVYDVIDGKQRIESILMFMGAIKGHRFSTNSQISDESEKETIDWKLLCKKKLQYKITGYKVQSMEVSGELSDIIDLFVRINSTGKALTPAEKRHAKYYNSEFLRTAGNVAERYEEYFRSNKILSQNQISRMKHVELVCELMVSIYTEDVINKKTALDKVMNSTSISGKHAKNVKEQCVRTFNRLKIMFPKLKETRLWQLSDFYTLAVLVWKFEKSGLILTDKKRNGLAFDLLRNFSNGVDKVRESQKKAGGIHPGEELYREYLLTVLQSTDEIKQRQKREEILKGILETLFDKKDKNRNFSSEQRRLIWNSEEEPKCAICGKPVTWKDFHADHIKPHSKGGKTVIENAALTHRSCNINKGNE